MSVGSPVAGRGQLRTEGLIGFFVNTLVLRTDLSGAPTFAELLARVRETSLAAYAHQDLPFEKLVEELHPQRDLGLAPLYQVSFVLDSDPLPALRLGDVEASLWPLETEIEKFDLSLTLGVGAEGLSGAIGFRSDLFDGTTIERLAGSFARLLAGAAAAPPLFLQQRLPELPLLSEEELEQLLRIGDGGGESYPREAALYDLFAEQAALSPDAVALASPGAVRRCGWPSVSTVLPPGWWRRSPWSRPVVPMCRWTPPTRGSGWPSCCGAAPLRCWSPRSAGCRCCRRCCRSCRT